MSIYFQDLIMSHNFGWIAFDGWEKKWDSNTLRFYYINHNTKVTQWNAPINVTVPVLG